MMSCVALVAFVRVDTCCFLGCLKLGCAHRVDRFLRVRLPQYLFTQEVPSDTIFCEVLPRGGL